MRLAAAALWLGIASPALAQPADEPPAVEVDGSEVIEVWGERPNKPFDRDTELRLTGEDLAQRGVGDLAEALELVPELHVRQLGRGGLQADIRGARKGAVKVLIDGVPVDEPFYGTFDLSSVPVTDIEQIRVSLSPSSPIDGVGGPGGVIEVHTRDAVGARMLRARGQGTGLHGADVAVTGRTGLGRGWAARGSASATRSSRDFEVAMPDGSEAALSERRRAATGALRLEWRREDSRRLVLDLALQHRSFVPPPGEEGSSDLLVIDGETTARFGAAADIDTGRLRLQGRAYAQLLDRDSTYFADALLERPVRAEQISGDRVGAALLLNRPHSPGAHLVASVALDSEAARVEDASEMATASGRATIGQAAAGAQLERGPLAVDIAAGLAAPIDVDSAPWPEVKLTVGYRPVRAVELSVTAARKGRLPTLRERYRSDIGNAALDPELATFGEVAVTVRPARGATARVAGFARLVDGMIRFDGERMALINLDELVVRGVDATAELSRGPVSGGASWSFQDASSARIGGVPLDFLPRYRATAWVGAAPTAHTGVRARARAESSQLDRGVTLASHGSLDLSVYARLGRHLFGTVRVDNVTDARYQERAGVLAIGRVVSVALQGDWE